MSHQAPPFPAAELDRRFYAFAIDRLIAWTLDAMVAVAAYRLLVAEGSVLAGVAVVVATVVVVGAGFSLLQGLQGFTPGKAVLGLRVLHVGSGTPIGLVPALQRALILGLAALPTFGLGLATLAWTAVMDRDRQRRGWHDHVTESVVVDIRPAPVEETVVEQGPRHIVNLTAMRLVPAAAPQAPAPTAPPVSRPAPRPTTPADTPATTDTPDGNGADGLRAPLGPAADPPAGAGSTVVREGAGPTTLRWRVAFDTGETLVVDGLALIGRRPQPRTGERVHHLVPLTSRDMSLSKTHAQIQVAPDGVLVVLDRGSTNGSVVVRGGVSRELPPGQPTTLLAGDVVRFGDRTMTVGKESLIP